MNVYSHPRWREKRARIIEMAGSMCSLCAETDQPLEVHHTFYEQGREIWEYPDDSLLCLCRPCHRATTADLRRMKFLVAKLSPSDLARVLGYIRSLVAETCGSSTLELSDISEIEGVADAFRVDTRPLYARVETARSLEIPVPDPRT